MRKSVSHALEPPRWDLSDLYAGHGDPRLDAEMAQCERRVEQFAHDWSGQVKDISSYHLARAIDLFEEIEHDLSRIQAYSELLHSCSLDDPVISSFDQNVRERCIAIAARILFFTLEVADISEQRCAEHERSEQLTHRIWWIKELRGWRAYQLREDVEILLAEKSLIVASLRRLYEDTIAAMRFSLEGQSLTLAEIGDVLADRSRARRRRAFMSIAAEFHAKLPLFSLIQNSLIKDKAIEDKLRGFPSSISCRNRENRIDDAAVDALVHSVRDAYPRLSHRYYRLKARWFGRAVLPSWDRNAPPPDGDDHRVPWHDARDVVLRAFRDFDGALADIAEQFFSGNWIDAAPRAGKIGGAFSHPVSTSCHPYILMNYQGRVRCVLTLAHELGHGVHQVLAGSVGWLGAQTPLTLAEVASVFAEMLTFRALLAETSNPTQRRNLLALKIEDMLNTVTRQIAFHEFESALHHERRAGELPPQRIGEIWMETQGNSLGPAIELNERDASRWASVPHFIHAPFYVYAYAFGECVVNSLYGVWQSGSCPDFPQRYRALLQAGGTLRYDQALSQFGLSPHDPGFWRQGLGVIEDMIDEWEPLLPHRKASQKGR